MTGVIPYFRPVLVLVTRLEAFTHVPMEKGEGEPIGTDVNKTAVASAVRCGACTTTTTSVKREGQWRCDGGAREGNCRERRCCQGVRRGRTDLTSRAVENEKRRQSENRRARTTGQQRWQGQGKKGRRRLLYPYSTNNGTIQPCCPYCYCCLPACLCAWAREPLSCFPTFLLSDRGVVVRGEASQGLPPCHSRIDFSLGWISFPSFFTYALRDEYCHKQTRLW